MVAKKFKSLIFGFTLIFGFLMSSCLFAHSVDDLYIGTEDYPPYNLKENGKLQGISIDLMDLMLRKLDSRQTHDNISILPWARGYFYLKERKYTCLFSTFRTKKREKLFKWVGPISSTTISLIARKDKNNSLSDIMKYQVGVVREDVGEQLIEKPGHYS